MALELSPRFAGQDYCRLCLSSIYELHALFPKGPNESNAVLMTKISLLAEIILVPSEELHAKICSRCIQQLDDFDSFRRRCKDSDSQIRKIRAWQRWNVAPGNSSSSAGDMAVMSKNVQTEQQQEQVKFGGIFDLMLYSECPPAEYYMSFDGFVYRKGSLLVWRCEFSNCPSQLLVENNFSKFWIFGTHNHARLASNDQRKFTKLDRRVCAYLHKLRDQMDGTSDNILDKAAGSAGAPQNSPSAAKQAVPANPETTEIQYSADGDKPSIFVNSYRYYKETVNRDVIPSEIYWRCNDKNCLGMVITTTDLRNYRMFKDHNHIPKAASDRCSIPMDFPVRVAALPMNPVQSSVPVTTQTPTTIAQPSTSAPKNVTPAPKSTPPESTPKPNGTTETRKVMALVVTSPKETTTNGTTMACTISPTMLRNDTTMTFYKDATNYYLYLSLFFYQREVCYSNTNSLELLWKCVSANCPGTIIVFSNLKFAPGLTHNHIPTNWTMRNLTKVSSAEALAKPTIVPEISFYRCVANGGIYLLYKQFIYSVLAFHPATNPAITWKCRNMGCDGQLRSGMQFQHLTIVKNHNHGPVLQLAVDVDSYLTVGDALKELEETSKKPAKRSCPQQLQDRIEKRIAAELRSKQRNQNTLKQRRKSTWC